MILSFQVVLIKENSLPVCSQRGTDKNACYAGNLARKFCQAETVNSNKHDRGIMTCVELPVKTEYLKNKKTSFFSFSKG